MHDQVEGSMLHACPSPRAAQLPRRTEELQTCVVRWGTSKDTQVLLLLLRGEMQGRQPSRSPLLMQRQMEM